MFSVLLLGEKFKGKKEKKSSRRTRMRQRAVDREIRRISPGDRITSEEEIKRGKREVMTKWGEGGWKIRENEWKQGLEKRRRPELS